MLAAVAVTDKGIRLAEKISKTLGVRVDVYAKNRPDLGETNKGGNWFKFDSLAEITAAIFGKYDGIILIMAAGIAVRAIAPHIRDKRIDPAVVVLDDGGNFAISLLSGHIGGANDLTEKIARTIEAIPVITTATDVAGRLAADTLAVKLNMSIEPFASLKSVNAAIANGKRTDFFTDTSSAYYNDYSLIASQYGVTFKDTGLLSDDSLYDAAVIVSDDNFVLAKPHIYLRTNSLAIGIGCRAGTSCDEILEAAEGACRKIGRDLKNVVIIGSTVYKKEEKGLLAFGQKINAPIKFFTNEELENCIAKHNFEISPFVKEKIGVGNVCEPAAVLAGKSEKLILAKTKYSKTAIAIAPAR